MKGLNVFYPINDVDLTKVVFDCNKTSPWWGKREGLLLSPLTVLLFILSFAIFPHVLRQWSVATSELPVLTGWRANIHGLNPSATCPLVDSSLPTIRSRYRWDSVPFPCISTLARDKGWNIIGTTSPSEQGWWFTPAAALLALQQVFDLTWEILFSLHHVAITFLSSSSSNPPCDG